MRKAFQVLAFVIATEVVVQAAAIAYALAGLGKWIEDDGGVLNKAVLDAESADFRGVGGFALHGINGMMIIPVIALAFLIVSFFAKEAKRGGLVFLLVAVQVTLGLTSHSVPFLAPLHAINGFAIFSLAVMTGVKAGRTVPATTSPAPQPVNA